MADLKERITWHQKLLEDLQMKIFEEKSGLVINLSWDKEAKAAESFQIRVGGSSFFHSLPPQRSWGKVTFSQASVILLTGGGGLPQCMLGYPPREQTPPPGSRHQPTHSPESRHPPGAEHAGRYGQRAGGTHPTGMQSCYFLLLTSECVISTVDWMTKTKEGRMTANFETLTSRLLVDIKKTRMHSSRMCTDCSGHH